MKREAPPPLRPTERHTEPARKPARVIHTIFSTFLNEGVELVTKAEALLRQGVHRSSAMIPVGPNSCPLPRNVPALRLVIAIPAVLVAICFVLVPSRTSDDEPKRMTDCDQPVVSRRTLQIPLLLAPVFANSPHHWIIDSYHAFNRATRTRLSFKVSEHSQREVADVIAILRDHFRRWRAIQPSRDEASQDAFAQHQIEDYKRVEASTWTALLRVCKEPALRSTLSQLYSTNNFDRIIAEALPAYLANHGVYCTPTFHAYNLPSGKIFFSASSLEFYDIAVIETADLGPELAQLLGRGHYSTPLRLLISPRNPAEATPSIAFDRAYYGHIEQRQDSIDREVNSIIASQASLMRDLGIRTGDGANFKNTVSLQDLRKQIREHVDGWELAAAVVRTMFLGYVHNLIEAAANRGERPYIAVSLLRKHIIDCHEFMHLEDEWDPKQRLYERLYSRLDDSAIGYRKAMADYQFHGEVNAIIGELRYGPSLMALDRLLSKAHNEDRVDSHGRAAVWVRDELLQILLHSDTERFGIKILADLDRSEQIKAQLYLLASDENRPQLKALLGVLTARHNHELGF